CNFSDKVNNAAAAGAIAVLIGNNQPAPILPNVAGATIPAFAIDQSDANALRAFSSSAGNNATAGIAYPASKISNTPDVLGDFSSRGPAGIFDLVKPDVTAPGVRVLAVIAGNEVTGSENAVGLMDGTSMASPHH
ncbi:S8 family serine peptidase, partial [Leptospira borgpetersenii serovar Balcanica]|uniref:PA domain-containing protein n=1 Tax=Leptospira borgpetersenii TaxID=174 RepID=UPI0018821A0B